MTREIPLSQNKVALVDDADFEWISQMKWCVAKNVGGIVYAVCRPSKRDFVIMHRLIMSAPKGVLVDHIDHDGLNNQRANLRLATPSQNAMNRRKTPGYSSRFKGVCFCKDNGIWEATIKLDGKTYRIGYFPTEIDGALAYDAAAREHFGPYCAVNFPIGTERCALVNATTASTVNADGR